VTIGAPDLAAALTGSDPPVVVAVTDPDSFAAGHIDGAVRIDWPDLELPATTPDVIAAWESVVRGQLAALGISPATPVAIYDGGTLFAARLWWVLDYLRHGQKAILDGGLPAWTAASLPVVVAGESAGTATAAASPVPDPYPTPADPTRLATRDQVMAALGDPGVLLVDARQPDEYAAGHIPGAINLPYRSNALPEDPKTYLPADDLRALYAAVGVTPDRLVIPYCSTGVRSAVTWVALRQAGFPDVALYSGSWNEWGADPETPKETN
jgi:thiosulfate/3-mercaptopyruvate sulfurtransferase